MISKEIVFVDSTHIKANSNRNKIIKEAARKTALFYEEELRKEIQEDRINQGKKPFDSDDDNPGGSGNTKKEVEVTKSKSNPESGLFHKGLTRKSSHICHRQLAMRMGGYLNTPYIQETTMIQGHS